MENHTLLNIPDKLRDLDSPRVTKTLQNNVTVIIIQTVYSTERIKVNK